MPSMRFDFNFHVGVHEDDIGIVTPWSAEVHSYLAFFSGNCAVIEYIAVRAFLWG